MQEWESRLLGCALCGSVEASGIPVFGGVVPAAGCCPSSAPQGRGDRDRGQNIFEFYTGGKRRHSLGPPLAD